MHLIEGLLCKKPLAKLRAVLLLGRMRGIRSTTVKDK